MPRHQDASLLIWREVVELTLFHSVALRRPHRGIVRQNAVLLNHVPARIVVVAITLASDHSSSWYLSGSDKRNHSSSWYLSGSDKNSTDQNHNSNSPRIRVFLNTLPMYACFLTPRPPTVALKPRRPLNLQTRTPPDSPTSPRHPQTPSPFKSANTNPHPTSTRHPQTPSPFQSATPHPLNLQPLAHTPRLPDFPRSPSNPVAL